eukprot:7379052-Prymnesium_polylepis.4
MSTETSERAPRRHILRLPVGRDRRSQAGRAAERGIRAPGDQERQACYDWNRGLLCRRERPRKRAVSHHHGFSLLSDAGAVQAVEQRERLRR